MKTCECCGFESLPEAIKATCELCGWPKNSKKDLNEARKTFLNLGHSGLLSAKKVIIKSAVPYKRKKYFELPLPGDKSVIERSLKEIQNPILRFKSWYEEAWAKLGEDADSIALATLNKEKIPQVRILYYRGLWENKFCFFTNYNSHKAQGLSEGAKVSIVFLWHKLDRQLRIEGKVQKADAKVSDAYFSKRPLESQLSALTSQQSQRLSSYNDFLREIEENRNKLKEPIDRPNNWGGYAIEASRIEFWHARKYRRHLRELYTREKSEAWKMELLYP